MIDFKALAEPFPEDVVLWRVGNISARTKKTTLLAYIDSRIVMDRLDDVVGPENWSDTYTNGPGGGIICTLGIRCGDEWVCKSDGAENTQIEAVKGGLSDALKRAAVKWGIGRYLYAIDAGWCEIKDGYPRNGGISVYSKKDGIKGWCQRPVLESWALPPKKTKRVAPRAAPVDAPEDDGGAETGTQDSTDDKVSASQLGLLKRQLNRLRAPAESWPTAVPAFLDMLGLQAGHPVKVLPEEVTDAAAGPLIAHLMTLKPRKAKDPDEERMANNAADNGDMGVAS